MTRRCQFESQYVYTDNYIVSLNVNCYTYYFFIVNSIEICSYTITFIIRARPCYVRSISAFGGGTLIMACARGCHWLRPRWSTDRKHVNDVRTLSRAYVTALFTTST
jgi:hypothetical protein